MAILKSDGIVLKSIPYGESSKIVTFLTRDHGKITMLARGARDMKSKFGGSLELFNLVSMIYYEKESRDIQYLSDVSIIEHYFEIRNQPERMFAAMSVLEIANRSVHGNEDCHAIYELVSKVLDDLNRKDKPVHNPVIFFLIQISELLGFRVEALTCPDCADLMNHPKHYFHIERGRVICDTCPVQPSAFNYPISKESIAVLRQFIQSRGNGIDNILLSKNARQELYTIILNHLQYHVEETRHLNSLSFFKS